MIGNLISDESIDYPYRGKWVGAEEVEEVWFENDDIVDDDERS